MSSHLPDPPPRSPRVSGEHVPPSLLAFDARLSFVSHSTAYLDALERVKRYARHPDLTVMFDGESGTGKSCLARYLHVLSPRAARVFHEVSLAALDDGLASSDLFGHVRGAFTDARENRRGHFLAAHGGTLFLDEIGKASPAVQKKLLRVLETREIWPVGADRAVPVDVRLVLATNISIDGLVAAGQFLPDLHARLGLFQIRIPPLRERRTDIPTLVSYFATQHAQASGYARAPDIHPELMSALQHAPWPYNLRQLDATIHRLMIDADGADILTPSHCTDDLAYLRAFSGGVGLLTPRSVERVVEEIGSVSGAARRLGIARTTVYRRLKGLGADAPHPTGDDIAHE